MEDVRTFLNQGRYQEAVNKFGEKTVRDEIQEMAEKMVDVALRAAHELKFTDLARMAAGIVINGGGYSEEINDLAIGYRPELLISHAADTLSRLARKRRPGKKPRLRKTKLVMAKIRV